MRNLLLIFVLVFAVFPAQSYLDAQVATGGQFSLSQSVVGNGGNSMQGGQFSLDGSLGQPIAGQKASELSIAVHAGYWIPDALIPTAAHVTVAGRVITTGGQGIRNATITMAGNGETRSVITGTFGYFQFDDVEVGRFYIFSVRSQRFQFPQPSIARSIMDASDDLRFIAPDH